MSNPFAAGLILVGIACPLFGQTQKTLYAFSDNPNTAPNTPNSTLVEVRRGLFYGTAQYGGANACGSLFSITSSGVYTDIHDFTPTEGCNPQGKLIQSVDGFLYGIASSSPFLSNNPSTLFRSDLQGNVTVIASFPRNKYLDTEALAPTAGADGSIYTMVYNLVSELGAEFALAGAYPFRYQPNGDESFHGSLFATGYFATPLIVTDAGIYGAFPNDLFQISPAAEIKNIAALPNPSGSTVEALGQGANGLLYLDGTINAAQGTGFLSSMNLGGGNYQIVQSFSETTTCFQPNTGFSRASDGSLYAGCFGDPPNFKAAIFKISSAGDYQVAYQSALEQQVFGSLSGLATQGEDGLLYGEVQYSNVVNATQFGSIYSLDLGLPKPLPSAAAFTPSSGSPGTSVIIYGDHFLDANSVTVNGVSAPFTVNSNSYLTITIPQGAATGHVQVTTPNGTGISTKLLTVTQ